MLKVNYDINENKINNWLDELENDRKKMFDEIKTSKSSDNVKEQKIQRLELIQKNLLAYKKLLSKENKKDI
jgi:hypothetical protein